jgi:asparagine synthetase B (glutamine-hydrolysing)
MKLFDPVLFRDGRPASGLDLSHAEDPASAIAAHIGHFAVHERDREGRHLLARDLLGVHKLFFAVRGGQVEAANYLVDLLRAGHPLRNVVSVPAGHCVRLHPGERSYELIRWGEVRFCESAGPHPQATLTRLAATIREALDLRFRLLARRFAGRPVYVSLSGGLDSTTIALLAKEHFEGLRAVTFALRHRRENGPGTDLHFARRVAADLGLPHVEVLADPGEVLDLLDDVLVYGQDFRDFNVHCGLVNAVIGKAIGGWHPEGPRPVVLTGDGMNELLADYAPVRFKGREYFGLPELDPGLTRRFLVGGLDSGDREVGIFARFGVETAQPFALCAHEYAALPSDLACGPGAKSRLSRLVMGDRIPEYVLLRSKVRAQVAVEGEPGGTLALLVDRGIRQDRLLERFARLLGIDQRAAGTMTRAGYYRFSTKFPETSRARRSES